MGAKLGVLTQFMDVQSGATTATRLKHKPLSLKASEGASIIDALPINFLLRRNQLIPISGHLINLFF
jgi:hypothetical protein